jgi:AP2 domain
MSKTQSEARLTGVYREKPSGKWRAIFMFDKCHSTHVYLPVDKYATREAADECANQMPVPEKW